ncbi:MAG TPA: branched-chain amino acid ABC transporter permease [bacterium]|nr:branched-chain amino acid ABC transporter permease [bacterium]
MAAALGGGIAQGVLVTHHFSFAVVAAMFYAALLGVGIERFAYKPLRNAPRIAALITAIGVSLFLENAGIIVWGERDKSYDDLNPTVGALLTNQVPPLDLGLVEIGQKDLLVLAVTVVLMVALQYLVMRTRVGKAMRAVSMDRDAARLMGINVDATISATFAIGSALAAAAGVLWGLYYNTLNPDMGIIPGIKAFVAAVLGGIGSIPGAMAGGIVMGVAENLVVGYLASSYRDAIAFAILIIILLVRPTGLFGSRAGEKV